MPLGLKWRNRRHYMQNARKWDDFEREVVKRLYEQGKTDRTISDALSKMGYERDAKAVANVRYKMGLKRSDAKADDVPEVPDYTELLKSIDASLKTIADALTDMATRPAKDADADPLS